MGTGIELLVMGNCVLRKQNQDELLRKDYSAVYELN
jgi:hypothetical protein